jgi:hypothetical protein
MIRYFIGMLASLALASWGYASIQAGFAQGHAGPIIGGILPFVIGIACAVICGAFFMGTKKRHRADRYFIKQLNSNLTGKELSDMLQAQKIRHQHPDLTGPQILSLVQWGKRD